MLNLDYIFGSSSRSFRIFSLAGMDCCRFFLVRSKSLPFFRIVVARSEPLWTFSRLSWVDVGRCGLLVILFGSLWVVVGRCGLFFGSLLCGYRNCCGMMWVAVDRCASFLVLPSTKKCLLVACWHNKEPAVTQNITKSQL